MIPLFIVEGEMMDKDSNKMIGFNLKEVILVIIVTALVTSLTTGVIVYNQNKLTKNLTYQDLNQDSALKEFLTVYASLIDEYYENVDKTAMLESAIGAMFNYLGEDYSTYMNKDESDALAEMLKGEYKGIGIEIDKQTNAIAGFIEGGAAESSGLMVGDVITSVNDSVIQNASDISSIVAKVNVGEKIKISVIRGEENLDFFVENKNLFYPAVQSEMLEDGIGYLKISTFSNTLKEQVQLALQKLESNDMQSLIIDLRNNTGGYLVAAKEVASMFLEKGKVIYSLEEKDDTKTFKDETDEKRDYKIVLLFNENSASASEVLIAALKESYGAITVGITSYGKGKVQQTYSLTDGSMVKYTSAKWLTPNGDCIDEIGITPSYVVEETRIDIDEQLNKAIEVAR